MVVEGESKGYKRFRDCAEEFESDSSGPALLREQVDEDQEGGTLIIAKFSDTSTGSWAQSRG
jgi:hypothetical protein